MSDIPNPVAMSSQCPRCFGPLNTGLSCPNCGDPYNVEFVPGWNVHTGASASAPNAEQGWQCPGCRTYYSPRVPSCPLRGGQVSAMKMLINGGNKDRTCGNCAYFNPIAYDCRFNPPVPIVMEYTLLHRGSRTRNN